jgi:hypothetical protein
LIEETIEFKDDALYFIAGPVSVSDGTLGYGIWTWLDAGSFSERCKIFSPSPKKRIGELFHLFQLFQRAGTDNKRDYRIAVPLWNNLRTTSASIYARVYLLDGKNIPVYEKRVAL